MFTKSSEGSVQGSDIIVEGRKNLVFPCAILHFCFLSILESTYASKVVVGEFSIFDYFLKHTCAQTSEVRGESHSVLSAHVCS